MVSVNGVVVLEHCVHCFSKRKRHLKQHLFSISTQLSTSFPHDLLVEFYYLIKNERFATQMERTIILKIFILLLVILFLHQLYFYY